MQTDRLLFKKVAFDPPVPDGLVALSWGESEQDFVWKDHNGVQHTINNTQAAFSGEPINATQATLTVDPSGSDNLITYTAVEYGVSGHDISIAYTAPVQAALTVSVADRAITVACGTKHRMVVTGTLLDPDVTGELLYAGLISGHPAWTSDGNAEPDPSGPWIRLMHFSIGWQIDYLVEEAGMGSWVALGSEEWPDGLTYVANDDETGTPIVAAALPTAQNVIDAVAASVAASALVTPVADGAVTGAVAAVSAANLAGAVNGTPAKLGRMAGEGANAWIACSEDNTVTQHGWMRLLNLTSPQTLTEEERDVVYDNLGISGTLSLDIDPWEGLPTAVPANMGVALSGDPTPIGLTNKGLWVGGNSPDGGEFTAIRGVDGWAISEGSDSGIIFKWKSDSPGMDRLGFAFEFESVHRAWLGNLNLSANRKYQVPDRNGSIALVEGPQTFSGAQTFAGQVELTGQTAAAASSAISKSVYEKLLIHDALLSTGGMIWAVSVGGGASCGDLKNNAAFTLNNLAATAWARSLWGPNNLATGSSGQGAAFTIKSEVSGVLYFRSLTGAACRVLAWDTAPATPYNLTQPAFTSKGVGIELFESGGNLVGRIVRHDGTTYRNSGSDFVATALPIFSKYIVFDLVGDGAGGWKLYLKAYWENEAPSAMALPQVAAISDGPTGTAVYPTVGSQTSVAIVSADGSTAFDAAVSAYAKSIKFKKLY